METLFSTPTGVCIITTHSSIREGMGVPEEARYHRPGVGTLESGGYPSGGRVDIHHGIDIPIPTSSTDT